MGIKGDVRSISLANVLQDLVTNEQTGTLAIHHKKERQPRRAVEAAIMEAVRRADEWGETRKAILSQNEILVPDAARLPHEAEPTIRRVFALLDGERTLRDVQELTRLGQFMLLRAAALLIRSGAARPLSAAEAFERGRSRAGKQEWDAALRMARYG